ncbi:unnamed protein product [Euphydryas editha]|uniref:Secreted protein n=1 Tax=Euphydryas editha TaxID=104508 RepID=A0AAU9UFP6_EUPED|nr:unnamed protein product [Euphydryas editha]
MSGYKTAALMLFIMATTVATYSEIPATSEEGNEMTSWPADLKEKTEPGAYWGRNLVIYNMLKQLQSDDERYDNEDDPNIDQKWSQLPDLKDPDEKKWVTALSTNTGKSTKSPNPRPQPKWKSKKGRGSPMLCYFKLCSFRSSA